jgi:hypothetical protein
MGLSGSAAIRLETRRLLAPGSRMIPSCSHQVGPDRSNRIRRRPIDVQMMQR